MATELDTQQLPNFQSQGTVVTTPVERVVGGSFHQGTTVTKHISFIVAAWDLEKAAAGVEEEHGAVRVPHERTSRRARAADERGHDHDSCWERQRLQAKADVAITSVHFEARIHTRIVAIQPFSEQPLRKKQQSVDNTA
ncbi:hypothetical protein N0V90_002857 [Kalmusia sp. IMI 367209]|nr:hypothetical protein N0V90_002857 [Kalmusia sp. IMI 367209]